MKDIFKDHKGNTSSMRIMTFMIVSIMMFVWGITCIRNNTIISFGYEDVSVLLTALGGKAFQKGKELNGKGGVE